MSFKGCWEYEQLEKTMWMSKQLPKRINRGLSLEIKVSIIEFENWLHFAIAQNLKIELLQDRPSVLQRFHKQAFKNV